MFDLAIVIPLTEEQKIIYSSICRNLSIYPEIIFQGTHEKTAKIVCEECGNNKTLIISALHSPISYVNIDKRMVVFDYHNDAATICEEMTDGNFLRERRNMTYILGTNIKSKNNRIKTYSPRHMGEIFREDLSGEVVYSLDIDVFNQSVTNAHNYPHDSLVERLAQKFGIEFHLNFNEVANISKALAAKSIVADLQIAGYNPRYDDHYKTAVLIENYVEEITNCRRQIMR